MAYIMFDYSIIDLREGFCKSRTTMDDIRMQSNQGLVMVDKIERFTSDFETQHDRLTSQSPQLIPEPCYNAFSQRNAALKNIQDSRIPKKRGIDSDQCHQVVCATRRAKVELWDCTDKNTT